MPRRAPRFHPKSPGTPQESVTVTAPTMRAAAPWERWLPLLFPLLALLLLREVLLSGRLLLPLEYLQAFSPWSAAAEAAARERLPQWNVLQWDGLAQFYP